MRTLKLTAPNDTWLAPVFLLPTYASFYSEYRVLMKGSFGHVTGHNGYTADSRRDHPVVSGLCYYLVNNYVES